MFAWVVEDRSLSESNVCCHSSDGYPIKEKPKEQFPPSDPRRFPSALPHPHVYYITQLKWYFSQIYSDFQQESRCYEMINDESIIINKMQLYIKPYETLMKIKKR